MQVVAAFVVALALSAWPLTGLGETPMEEEFHSPPDSARAHTWWHWMNGNVSQEGITKDLEAMRRVGLGGFHAFHVADRIPSGPVGYMSPEWRRLMTHAVREAARLELDVCLHNCAGWSSSGGPWVAPRFSMMEVTSSERSVEGPQLFTGTLEQPATKHDYYREIAVLAFPTPPGEEHGQPGFRLPDWKAKAGYDRNDRIEWNVRTPPNGVAIDKHSIANLTPNLQQDGTLHWRVPEGSWTIVRFGYTTTGRTNRQASPDGEGLECDKLSRDATDLHWEHTVQKVLDDSGPLAGKTLTTVLIDSFEVGQQNWTHDFASEFANRCGYDLTPYLPALTGRLIGSADETERFLWDFRLTIADMFAERYFGHWAELCHKRGLRLAIEPYGMMGNFHDFEVAKLADLPMGEFWVDRPDAWHTWSAKLAASAAHSQGKAVVGAEAFTARPPNSTWIQHPYSLKAIGDLYFSHGINQFIFHTYVHQPWPDNIRPGMTMGPHGIQLNRNNTWFEQSRPWLDYLARCQYMLRQGEFVADICYLASDDSPNQLPVRSQLQPQPPEGYDYDVLAMSDLAHLEVDNGKIVLPSGMRYEVLVLPPCKRIRPHRLRELTRLVNEGACVIGTKPTSSPSLQGYPECDTEVVELADQLWSSARHVIDETALWTILYEQGVPRDFECEALPDPGAVVYLHRRVAGRDVYFVSNQVAQPLNAQCIFRDASGPPQLWHPEDGTISESAFWARLDNGRTRVLLQLDPKESVFVVFAPSQSTSDAVVSVYDAAVAMVARTDQIKGPEIISARYGPPDRNGLQHDVTDELQSRINLGRLVADVDDRLIGQEKVPSSKVLIVDYEVDGKQHRRQVPSERLLKLDSKTFDGPDPPRATVSIDNGTLKFTTFESGEYGFTTASGKKYSVNVETLPPPRHLDGPWHVSLNDISAEDNQDFTLRKLSSLSDHSDATVRFHAGTAAYQHTFTLDGLSLADEHHQVIDFGDVQVIADVSLNGKLLGTIWKPPYTVDVTDTIRIGQNDLTVRVTSLWPNRLIGAQRRRGAFGQELPWLGLGIESIPKWLSRGELPPTARDTTFSTWQHWVADDHLLPSGLIGPVTLYTGIRRNLDN